MTTPLDITDFVYNTGTLTIAAGDTTAVFSGTSLSANIKDGDTLCAGGVKVPIKTVTDDTHAELFTAWDGTAVTGGAYIILKDSMLRNNAVQIGYDTAAFLSFLDNTTIWYVVEGAAPDPSVGEEGNRALKTNVTPWVVWLKTGGVWVEQAGSPGVQGDPGDPGATWVAQAGEPDTDYPVGSLWLDSDSMDLDVYQLGGSPIAWDDTGINLKGATGAAGLGVPAGGTTGQVLSKVSGTDNDTEWADPSGGGDVAGDTHAATSKTTPVDADELPLVDSEDSNVLKKLTWANLKAFFATAAQGAKADSALQGAFGFRNRVVNPSGQIAQSGVASTSDGNYTGFDQWLALTQTGAVTPSSVTNAENGTPFMMRLTQAQATAQRFGIIQPIESANIIDARGQSVTLSARVRMSASTTLRYAIIEWTGTADTITKDVVSSWTSTTFTTGNFFNSTGLTIAATGSVSLSANTLTSISLAGAVSGSMNNVLVFFWTDSTQAQTVTLDIGKVQLEIASSSSPLAFRSYQQELILCQRYLFYWTAAQFARFAFLYADTTTSAQLVFNLPATLRTNPTLTQTNMTANGNDITSASIQGMFATVLALNYVTSGLTANTMVQMYVKTSVTGVVKFDARL